MTDSPQGGFRELLNSQAFSVPASKRPASESEQAEIRVNRAVLEELGGAFEERGRENSRTSQGPRLPKNAGRLELRNFARPAPDQSEA